jgi:hypothetical protein
MRRLRIADCGLRIAAERGEACAIELRIEELVLYGFSPADRLRIAAALEGELARLLAERGLPQGLADGAGRDAIDAGSFVRGPLATPVSIGGEVAHAVYGGLSS